MINKIATSIRGKNSPLYKNSVANVKNGDICVIVNAMDPLFTGKKLKFKNLIKSYLGSYFMKNYS